MYIEDPKTLEEYKEQLQYKKERLRAVWDKMDSRTREYDKLLKEIDDLVCKIKWIEKERSINKKENDL